MSVHIEFSPIIVNQADPANLTEQKDQEKSESSSYSGNSGYSDERLALEEL